MIPEWARRARGGWKYTGEARPPFAQKPRPGQESVWDYPRPPRIDPVMKEVIVRVGPTIVGRSTGCLRVLETASPPTVYMPPNDIAQGLLEPAGDQHQQL